MQDARWTGSQSIFKNIAQLFLKNKKESSRSNLKQGCKHDKSDKRHKKALLFEHVYLF